MDPSRRAYGPLVRVLRQARGLTLSELGSRTGLSHSHLSKLERGRNAASWEATVRLAETLGVCPDHLTGQLPVLRPLRELLGHTDATAFAYSVVLNVAELEDIELGKADPTPGIVNRIARRLGVPPGVLIPPTSLVRHKQ